MESEYRWRWLCVGPGAADGMSEGPVRACAAGHSAGLPPVLLTVGLGAWPLP